MKLRTLQTRTDAKRIGLNDMLDKCEPKIQSELLSQKSQKHKKFRA